MMTDLPQEKLAVASQMMRNKGTDQRRMVRNASRTFSETASEILGPLRKSTTVISAIDGKVETRDERPARDGHPRGQSDRIGLAC